MVNTFYKPKLKDFIPKREANAHKGNCGKVAILAGSSTMMGAAILCAKAALRSGSGLVYLFTVDTHTEQVFSLIPEVIVIPLPSTNGFISKTSIHLIKEKLDTLHVDVLVIGPGLGRNNDIQLLLENLNKYISEKSLKSVWDADALFFVSKGTIKLDKNAVITPHVGEFNTLFKLNVTNEFDSRLEGISTFLDKLDYTIVLKGANTLILNKVLLYKNDTGCPEMATAGMGDVLSGIIGSLIAQKMDVFHASIYGVFCHGLAGERQAKFKGKGIIASDVADEIALVMKEYEDGYV